MRLFARLLSFTLLAVALSGCVEPDPDDDGIGPLPEPGPDLDPVWYTQSGVQCGPRPWDAWRDSTGYEPKGEKADGAFENDEQAVDTIRAYYATKQVEFDDVQAYRDDLGRVAVCGAGDGRHYWVRTLDQDFDAAADGWNATDQTPKTLTGNSDPSSTSNSDYDSHHDDDADDTTWYLQNGVQCAPRAWQTWAQQTGYQPTGNASSGPFVNDDQRIDTIRAYYASKNVTFADIRAYRDDLYRTQVCGSADGWHHWVREPEGVFDAEAEGWTATDEEPIA